MSKKHGGYYKIKFFCCWASEALAKRFRMDFRALLEAILGSGEAWRVPSEGTLVKQRNWDLSGRVYNPPPNNFGFWGPVGGIREGKPHTLHPPSAKAYGVGGLLRIRD